MLEQNRGNIRLNAAAAAPAPAGKAATKPASKPARSRPPAADGRSREARTAASGASLWQGAWRRRCAIQYHAVSADRRRQQGLRSMKIRTAVFPVAGRGTRFLPATKASPKEMLPIVDKPLIQYAAEEALAAGAEKLVFITGSAKRAIEDHFDTDHELERELEAQGKQDLLDAVRGIVPSYASCIYIRQPAPLGLGHAVLCSRPAVGDEPFFVHLADDLIDAEEPCLKQMARVFDERGASVLGVQTVEPDQTDKYGIVAVERVERAGVAGHAHRRKAQAARTRRRTSPSSAATC